jgi:hypothetical protein
MTGDVGRRPMDIGSILDVAFGLYRRYFVAIVGTAAVVTVPLALLESPLVISDSENASVLATPIEYVMGFLIAAPIAVAIDQAARGEAPTIASAWRRTAPRLGGLFLAMLLTLLAIVLGLLAVLVGAIVVSVLLALTAPALVLESLSATGAMRRSRRLVSGSFWRVLGIIVVANIVVSIANVALEGAARAVGFAASSDDLALIGAVLVTSLLVKPFGVLVTVLLYFDQRLRREGSDVEAAIDALGPPVAR